MIQKAARAAPAAQAAVQIGRLMLEEQTGIESIDLNPIMVGPTGQGCYVADALIWRGNT